MLKLKKLLLIGALVLVARTPHAHARPHIFRRACCQPAPVHPAWMPQGQYALAAPPVLIHATAIPPSLFPTDGYQRIAPPAVPVPSIPPAVVMPAAGSVTLPPSRVTQLIGGAVQRVCGPQGCR